MTPTEVAATLRQFNEWRRGDYEPSEQPAPPDPIEIGEAIDAAVEMIERLEAAESECLEQARLNGMGGEREAALMAKLEAAEKSDAESLTMYRKARDERDALRAALQHEADCVEAAKAEIKALRAKIAEMEQQVPVAEWIANRFHKYPQLVWNEKYRVDIGDKLYALPGAKGEEK